MNPRHRLLVVWIGLLFLLLNSTAWSKSPMQVKSGAALAGNRGATEKLTPEKVDAYLAGLTDAQARQVLSKKLKQEVAAKAVSAPQKKRPVDLEGMIAPVFYRVTAASAAVLQRLGSVFSEWSKAPDRWPAIVDKLSGGKGALFLFWTLCVAALVIGCGLVLKHLFARATAHFYDQVLNTTGLSKTQVLARALSRALIYAIQIGVYVLVTIILFVLLYEQGSPGYIIVSNYLIVSYYLLLIAFAADIIFAPAAKPLRLFPLQDADADFLYRWMVRIAVIAGIIGGTSWILKRAGISEHLHLSVYGAAGVAVILMLAVMIWQSRQRVAEAILPPTGAAVDRPRSFRAAFAANWHFLAILYVLLMGTAWMSRLFLEGQVTVLTLILSIFLIPIFFGIDQWGQRLLKIASGELPETVDLSQYDEPQEPVDRAVEKKKSAYQYIPFIRRVFHITLLALLFFLVLRMWGLELPYARIFTRDVFGIIVALLLGVIVWEFTKSRIDQKLREEMRGMDDDREEGGAGGSRSGTLLLLLRKFMLAVLFVIVSLSILASLGVNIGPLIAGAGVVGLAIGFGAQTLVKDIIAGVFFLIDDAFRVGDYVEAGSAKGMVEQISLRSMKLRHPRGMVFTLPFGDVKQVTNFSRDYIITKLDIRVRFDTDLEKIRKIIKKINNELKQDEEITRVLLSDIKSQGVREMDDSAMILRVKFKTLPGEQFVIRREVYHRIQKAFGESGIEFAHRNVTVYLPPESYRKDSEGGSGATDRADAIDKRTLSQAGAAAASAVIQAEEAEKKSKKQ